MHIKLAVNKLRFFEFTFNKLGVKMIIMPSTVRSSSYCNCSKPSISIETVLENTLVNSTLHCVMKRKRGSYLRAALPRPKESPCLPEPGQARVMRGLV